MSQDDGNWQPDDHANDEYNGQIYNAGDYVAAPDAYGGEPYGVRPTAVAANRGVIKDSEDDEDAEGEVDDGDDQPAPPVAPRGRRAKAIAPDSEDGEFETKPVAKIAIKTTSGRKTSRPLQYASDDEDDDEEVVVKPRSGRLRRGGDRGYSGSRGDEFVVEDEEDGDDGGYGSRRRSTRASERNNLSNKAGRPKRRRAVDESYEGEEDSGETSEDDTAMVDLVSDDSFTDENRPRKLREKAKIDYYAIPPLETNKSKDKGKQRKRDENDPFAGLPHNLTGAQWAALYPEKGGQADSVSLCMRELARFRTHSICDMQSDDDMPNLTSPRKAALFSSNAAAAVADFGNGGMFAGGAGGMDISGGPGNLGKVGNPAGE